MLKSILQIERGEIAGEGYRVGSQNKGIASPCTWTDSIQYLDPSEEIDVRFRRLPHWSQAGTLAFVTWRTADSMPKDALLKFRRERFAILRRADVDPESDWQSALRTRSKKQLDGIQRKLFEAWDKNLDHAFGACVLDQAEILLEMRRSLKYFDNDRYLLTDFVIMPNHIHLIAAFDSEDRMLTQGTSWKRFTGRAINQKLGLSGEFWQPDQFDHLIRNEDQLMYYRSYIRDNARKAGLVLPLDAHYSLDLKTLIPK